MKLTVIFGIIVIMIVIASCVPATQINDFKSCVNAGNPVMESYPRKCVANGEVFVEELDKPLLGGCGTVTPGYNDECCANVNKDVPHPACAGEWKWNFEKNICEYVCTTPTADIPKAVLYKEENQMKRILCEEDSDCTFEKLQGTYSELDLPSCSAQLFCKEGICMYSC
ncbi:hypothetical protein JW851_03490 [Candidatus Woesearchaeota archaeon]|nr:hypothetical protein [Candidatus Woesearchaeota archaeon]